jgi:hypothetical protein
MTDKQNLLFQYIGKTFTKHVKTGKKVFIKHFEIVGVHTELKIYEAETKEFSCYLCRDEMGVEHIVPVATYQKFLLLDKKP